MHRNDYYHCGKLSLFNVRLLWDVQEARALNPEIEALVQARAARDHISGPISLMHQSTFLGHAYIVLVLLNEYIYKHFTRPEKRQFKEVFSKLFDIVQDTEHLYSESRDPKIGAQSPPRDLTKREEFFRTLRNALAHACVVIQEDAFEFYNEGETDRAVIKLTWEKLGLLCDATIAAYTSVLWPRTIISKDA
jgi:hypothetical protein